MKRKITVEVKNNHEARAIELALQDKTTLATVLVIGLLLPQSENARRRILQYVQDEIRNP